MKKIIIVLVVVSLIAAISSPFLMRLWQESTNSNKYDLDYVLKNLPKGEYKQSDKGITIQGLFFPKEAYRILHEDQKNKTVTIQFKNPDTSEADYVVPLRIAEVQDLKTNKEGEFVEMTYRGRKYNLTNANFITHTKDYILVQMLQPPPGLRLKYDFKLSFGELMAILQILTILIAVVLYFRESRREKNIAKREIYQKLELASIDLFKFEVQNAKDLWCVYSAEEKFPEKNTAARWAVQEYVCQIMNLFEMIIEFKIQEIIDEQVFLSWVQWFWDMSCADNFEKIWDDVGMNYTAPLRKAINSGITIAKRSKEINQDGYKEFLGEIGKQFAYTNKQMAEFLNEGEG